MQNSDPDWPDVAALQRGEDAALDRLIERHRGALLGFVTRMIGHTQDAEEIAQEAFVRVYFQIHQFRPRAPFVAWLYQIARNLCRDYFRSRAYKQRQVSDGLEALKTDLVQPDEASAWAADRMEAVQVALLKLPVRLRESLVLTAIEGLSHAEAGARLGISAKAVEVRSYRARAELVKILKSF